MTSRGGRTSPPVWGPVSAIAVVFFVAAFAQRVYLPLDIGERQPGILEFLPACLALLAGGIVLASRGRALAPLRSRQFLFIWAPYLLLLLLLPLVGVATGHFPLRGLAAMRTPVYALAAIVVGAAVRTHPRGGYSAWKWPMMMAASAMLAYALFQQLLVAHVLPQGPWDTLVEWDRSTQRAYGLSVIVGRSTGFFSNPNILGVWAGLVLLAGAFILNGKTRYLVAGTALGSLVLSESRGPVVAVAFALLVALAAAVRRHEAPRVSTLVPYATVVGAVLVGWGILALWGTPAASLIERLTAGASLVTGGTDPNFAGRVQFWTNGLALLRTHPFGTFGPPELLLGTAVDSEWVRTLLQGGPLLLVALAMALIGGAWFADGRRADGRALRAASLFMIVAGVAEIPLQYPPALVYWALVGAWLSGGREPVPEPGTVGAATEEGGNDSRTSLLMVATLARTLDAFMRPQVAALRRAGWRVDGMARGISASANAGETYEATWEVGWARQPLALANLRAASRVRTVVRRGCYDIVHVHTPVAALVTRFALRAREAGRPTVIYTAHGFHFHRGGSRLSNLLYATLERIAARWTDELVVINEEDHQAALDLHLVNGGHLHRVHGVGIDLDRFDRAAGRSSVLPQVRNRFGLPAMAPLIVSVAELNHNKNLGYLVQGLARMQRRDAHLVIVGDGPQHNALTRLASTLGVGERVHLTGHITDVVSMLSVAAVFALVSRREGLPVSMIEAMAMGVPVVGTDTRGIRDLLSEKRGTIVPLDAPDALAAALDGALSGEASGAMAATARRYVRTELGVEHVVAQYAAIYQEALAKRGRGPRATPFSR